ncbi:MAG: NRDE family protein [Halioglobus sp.]|nr:NRDE family protein [Halioglobus sp.]
MCLLIFAHRCSRVAPLALAANRDEFHARPTAAAGFWAEHPELLAGRDLAQGGTWMGVTRDGRFAAVTNFRDPSHTGEAPRSRGELPLDYLIGRQSPDEYLREVAARSQQYAGFNLLLGDGESLWYFDNNPGELPMELAPGVYGLSNARLDTPWPKVELGKRAMRALLHEGEWDHDALASVVADRRLADSASLQLPAAGSEMERMLSAQFILSEHYGTRATTTLWSDGTTMHWREKSFNAAGEPSGVSQETFRISSRG